MTPNGSTYRLGGGGGTLTMANGLVNVGGTTNLDVGVSGNNSTVVLSAASTYTGTTTVNGGVLLFSNLSAVGGSVGADITVTSPGAVSVGFALDQAFLGRIVNTSTGTIALGANSSNNLDFSAAGANLTAARLGASGAFTYSGTLTPNGTAYRLGGGGGTLTMANSLVNVSGTTNLDVGVAGVPGAVVLNAASTYLGTTTINGGTLRAGAVSVFAPTSAFSIASGAVLDLNGNNQTIGSLAGAGNVTLGSGSLTMGGNNTSTTYTGVISGTGTFTMNGTGTFTLNGTATWTGPLVVSGGAVFKYDNQSRFNVTGSGAITLDNGTLYNTITGNAGTFVSTNRNIVLGPGGGTLRWDGDGVPADLIIVQNTAPGTQISGVGGLTKTGIGIIAVGGPVSTYLGPTHVVAGTLRVRNNSNEFPIGTALTVDSGATFDLGTSILNQQVGSLAGAGTVNVPGGTFTVGDATSTAFSGIIQGASGKVTKVGAGALTLTGASTYTGATTISGGVLSTNVLANGGVGSGIGASTNVVGNLVLNGGTLQYTGAAVSTDRLLTLNATGGTIDASGSGALTLAATGTVGGTGTRALTLTGTNTGANTFAPILSNATSTSLTKAGAGTWILTAANTYAGGTTINAGTLLVNGQTGANSGTGTGAVTVNNTGTFGGTGRAAGDVTVNTGGKIQGGGAAGGTLTVAGNVTLNSGAIQGFRVTAAGTPSAANSGGSSGGTVPNPANNGFVDIGVSLLPLGDPATFQYVIDGTGATFTPGQSYSYQVARIGTDVIGAFAVTNQAQFTTVGFDATPFTFEVTGNGAGAVFLNFVPVPEPATVLGLAAGAMGLGGLVRRRFRRA